MLAGKNAANFGRSIMQAGCNAMSDNTLEDKCEFSRGIGSGNEPGMGIPRYSFSATHVTGIFVPEGVRENPLRKEAGMPMRKYKRAGFQDHQKLSISSSLPRP
jgi:hypothetical protein